MLIRTPRYDGGTYSHPNVVQSRLPGTILSYDFILLLKNLADPTTPIIIDTDAEVRWVGTAGVGTTDCMMFDNAFYLGSGTELLRTEFDGRTYSQWATTATLVLLGFITIWTQAGTE